GPDEPRDRRAAVPVDQDGRDAPRPGLPEARHHRAGAARRRVAAARVRPGSHPVARVPRRWEPPARSPPRRHPMLHHHDRNYIAARTEERLVRAASAGDQAAWSALGARFEKQLRWVARGHGLGAHDTDDVVQETMLKLFRNIVRIRDPRALGAWLTTTAR